MAPSEPIFQSSAVAGAFEGGLVLVVRVEGHAVLLSGVAAGRPDPAVAAVAGALELPVDAVALEGAGIAVLVVALDAARALLELLAVHAEGLDADVDERLGHDVHVPALDADGDRGTSVHGVDGVEYGELHSVVHEFALELLDVLAIVGDRPGEYHGLAVLVRVLGAHGLGGDDALLAVAVDHVRGPVREGAGESRRYAVVPVAGRAGSPRLGQALEQVLDDF